VADQEDEKGTMDIIYFGGGALAGIIGWMVIFATLIWPKMKQRTRVQQLKTLTAFHFFRYFATTLFIAGLVSRKLPSSFTDPTVYGDLVSLVLAYIAFIVLHRSRTENPATLLPAWVFNIVGTADLLLAMVLGPSLIHSPGDLGLGYIIPTVYVPLLLVVHFYALRVLGRRASVKGTAIHQASTVSHPEAVEPAKTG
jgi:predicted neutral ceramidase superfamily lipid hydrolase